MCIYVKRLKTFLTVDKHYESIKFARTRVWKFPGAPWKTGAAKFM